MATAILIDDQLARQAQAFADRSGRSLARFVEEAIARDLSIEAPATQDRPVGQTSLMRTFGGDGIVDGLSLQQAISRADLEADLETVRLIGGAHADG